MMLNNKNILVFGAAGLLGSSVVNAILEAGARVIAVDLKLSALKERFSGISESQISFFEADITSEESVKKFFLADDLYIDGAVNATYPRNKSYGKHFFEVGLDSFNENLALHLGSAFLFSQQCAAYFERRKVEFSLVNFSSIYGVVAPKFSIYEGTDMTMPVEYAAIKSAIQHLNKYIVSYVGNSKFRINCISPGGLLAGQDEKFIMKYNEATLGKGMLTPDDMVGSVVYLLSEQSKYVNGQNIVVDDGFTL